MEIPATGAFCYEDSILIERLKSAHRAQTDRLASKLAAAEQECERLRAAMEDIRDCVLNEREGMAEMDFGSDRVNAVLGIIDDRIASAARTGGGEGKE